MSLVNLHPALARLDELAAAPPTGKPSLIGYTREELTEFIKNAGEKSFRADQLYEATENMLILGPVFFATTILRSYTRFSTRSSIRSQSSFSF